jgi:CheY-like chemotaxis protein
MSYLYVFFFNLELRNPLNGIIGFTSLILDSILSDQQRNYAEAISSISNYMCNIINQSLDLCQTQSHGTTHSDIGPLRLREIVEFGFLTVTVLARTKGTELRLQDNLTPMQIAGQNYQANNGTINMSQLKNIENKWYGDEDTVRKILLNYLTNAIKHTGSGTVTVRLETESDKLQDGKEGFMAKCSVEDTGPGISQKDLKRLFLPYSKLVSSFGEINIPKDDGTSSPNHQQSQRSSGLGLSICKELADKMGGKVGVESVLGKGSNFWFTFPVYTSMPENTDDCPDTGEETSSECEGLSRGKSIKDVLWKKSHSDYRDDFENGRKNILTNSIRSTSSTSSVSSCSRSDCSSNGTRRKHKKPAKVLMVEDNEINQRIASKYLEKMGEKVTIAANGIEALEKMKNETFDILFVDLQMPYMVNYFIFMTFKYALYSIFIFALSFCLFVLRTDMI